MSRTWHLTEAEAQAATALMMVGSLMMAYRYDNVTPDAKELNGAMTLAHEGCQKLGLANIGPLMHRLAATVKDV